MITTGEDIQAGARALGVNPYWHAYTMVTDKPYGFGFVIWNGEQWKRTRERLGLTQDDMPNLSGGLFGSVHLETLADAVNKSYGVKT